MSVIAFVSLASWTASDYRMSLLHNMDLKHPSFLYAYLALALQGGILQAIGCAGALRMSERLLNAYWTLMLLLLAGDVVLGIVWLFRFHTLAGSLRDHLRQRLAADYGHDMEFQVLWDRLQAEAECCGVDSPRDFAGSEWLKRERQDALQQRQLVPRSCCRMAQLRPSLPEPEPLNASCVESDRNPALIHDLGCYDKVHRWLTHSANVLAVIGFCVIAFLKLCFLGILRYEIREMIQKIKVLRDMSESPGLMDPGGPASMLPGSALAQKMRRQRSEQMQKPPPPPNGNNNEAELQQPLPPASPPDKKSSSPV